MIKPSVAALICFAALAGCDGTNPFMDETPETTDPTDPNTVPTDGAYSQFAFDRARGLTMNRVTYDAVNDDLIINNLPFDGEGEDGDNAARYDAVAGTATTSATGIQSSIYESRQTATTGVIKHYAIFIRGDFLEGTAAAGRDWASFGNAGANINRASFNLPADGEYQYVGVYGATRTFDERSGIELVTGDVTLYLDVNDFDPSGSIQGDIIGTVTNRVRVTPGLTGGGDLPDITLVEVSFDTETGVWKDGGAVTFRPNGDQRDIGTHDGLIGGPQGQELGGYVVMEGVADIQVVTYEIQRYDDGAGGVQIVTGLQYADPDALQALANNFITIGLLEVDLTQIPSGWTLLSTEFDTTEIDTDFNAREVGVYIGDVVIP